MKKRRSKPTLEESLYVIPKWLTDRKKFNLAKMDVNDIAKLREDTQRTAEINRQRYEKAASAYTRLRVEAKNIYPDDHEVIKLLIKHPVSPPPNLVPMFNRMQTLWAKERQAEAQRLHKNELARVRAAIRREEKRLALMPKAPPQVLALPALTHSSIREQRLAAARIWKPETILGSDTIQIKPSPGVPLVDISTAGQLMMFGAPSDLSGVNG